MRLFSRRFSACYVVFAAAVMLATPVQAGAVAESLRLESESCDEDAYGCIPKVGWECEDNRGHVYAHRCKALTTVCEIDSE